MKMNRRNFLKTTAAAAGTFALPAIVPSSVFGASAPSNRVGVGCIGAGVRGGILLKEALYLKQAQVVAVSDCFASKRKAAIETIKEIYNQEGRPADANAKEYADFQELLACKDIDAVIVATPDHWHVPAAMRAVGSGKDVYVEKPLSVSVDTGFALRKLVQDKKAVFQYGTQQRSDHYFRFACELTRNGYIGKLQNIDVWCASVGGHKLTTTMPPAESVPADLDYDRWIGPAPTKPYSTARCTNEGAYHIYDYALGYIAGWGAHPLDIAQWGNNTDTTSPIFYEGAGTVPTGGLFDTVSAWDIHCSYANGVKMHFMDNGTAIPVVSSYYAKLQDHGTTFHGDEGWITVRRGAIDFSDEKLRRVKLKDNELHLYQSQSHMGNFIDCVKDRKKPISTIEAAVQSDLISHLSNAVVRLNRSIRWDTEKEQVVADSQVYQTLNRSLREPWHA